MKALTTEELREMQRQDYPPIIINTLSPEDFKHTHIPESINIPQTADDFVEQAEQAAGGKDQPVVVYCASKQCDSSPKAAKKLEDAGFQQVYDYEGGAKAWQDAGEVLIAG